MEHGCVIKLICAPHGENIVSDYKRWKYFRGCSEFENFDNFPGDNYYSNYNYLPAHVKEAIEGFDWGDFLGGDARASFDTGIPWVDEERQEDPKADVDQRREEKIRHRPHGDFAVFGNVKGGRAWGKK